MMLSEDPFAAYRGRPLGLAYRMLGSLSDAEDILQDAYLKYASEDRSNVKSLEAFMMTMVTRLCLDRLKSARVRREVYTGPWLPEPVTDVDTMSPETALELADDLSFALLLTLERLTESERAAFLLHDVFDRPFSEIASMLGKSEAACRQLAARARKAVRGNRKVKDAKPSEHEALLAQFVTATASGDVSHLQSLLLENAVAYSDGGGVKIAALNPIVGADKIARFISGLAAKALRQNLKVTFQQSIVNGAPALLMYVDDLLDQTISIDVDNGRIAAMYMVRNPEKLGAVVH